MKRALLIVCMLLAFTASAFMPGRYRGFRQVPRVRPHRPPVHRAPPPPRHHAPVVPFVYGIGAGMLLSHAIIHSHPTPPPPVVALNPIWIPPVYESRPVYDSYGRIVRYEQVLVKEGYWQY